MAATCISGRAGCGKSATMQALALTFASIVAVGSALAVTVHPADDGRALVNPGMGWTMHYYSNVPKNYGSFVGQCDSLTNFPGCSTVYLRIPWACLEPEEGVYNWAALDSPAQRWISRGGQVAFRITTSDWLEYSTPKWVFDAGAKYVRYNYGFERKGGPSPTGRCVDPDFTDPVYLDRLERFLKAFAARYDGRREVAFVDIGTYGLWGEGHTSGSSRIPQAKMNVDIRRHIDLHLKYFRRTQLVISDDVSGPWPMPDSDPELLSYARAHGVGWRDDSIMVMKPPRSWFHENQATLFWPTLPVVLEHEHYAKSLRKGAWLPDGLERAVEGHHASYMSIHGDPWRILSENRGAIDRINRRLGYRFLPVEVTWPDVVRVGERAEPFSVSWRWQNEGVAPPYRDYWPALTVKDSAGGIVAVLADGGLNLRTLPVGPSGQAEAVASSATFSLGRWLAPKLERGTYDVFVSVGECDGTPVVELPLPRGDGQRRYLLGRISFEFPGDKGEKAE